MKKFLFFGIFFLAICGLNVAADDTVGYRQPAVGQESDPIVGAINGIPKADGAGNISQAQAGTDYLAPNGDGQNLSNVVHSESDPVFTAWDKDYDDLTNKPAIPTALADLTDDSTHRLTTDTEKSTWNAKQAGHVNLTSLAALSFVSTSFVKMTTAGTFGLDTNTYMTADEKVKNVSGDASAGYLAEKLAALYPNLYQRDQKWALKTPYSTAANRYTILTPAKLSVDINGTVYFLTAQAEIALSSADNWDTTSPTNYTTAANRAGKDFYIYACVPVSGSSPKIVLSANSTTPSGYSASTSRKIGGFHGLCVAVGTISGHTLTDFVAGDVLPASIWDLLHRPVSNPEGMVYSEAINKWVDIYLASGTGSSTASVYGGTISDSRNWNDFVDDGAAVKKRMLDDGEFQVIAAGSNEQTNIYGSSDPGTTGGHVDTASRRMISNIGVEDACGVMWQWLSDQSSTYDAEATEGWQGADSGKGYQYYLDYTRDIKLFAGGRWGSGGNAGSRSRYANFSRWDTSSTVGCRFCAEPV